MGARARSVDLKIFSHCFQKRCEQQRRRQQQQQNETVGGEGGNAAAALKSEGGGSKWRVRVRGLGRVDWTIFSHCFQNGREQHRHLQQQHK